MYKEETSQSSVTTQALEHLVTELQLARYREQVKVEWVKLAQQIDHIFAIIFGITSCAIISLIHRSNAQRFVCHVTWQCRQDCYLYILETVLHTCYKQAALASELYMNIQLAVCHHFMVAKQHLEVKLFLIALTPTVKTTFFASFCTQLSVLQDVCSLDAVLVLFIHREYFIIGRPVLF